MNGNPFELRRPEYAKIVKFGGYVSVHTDENGRNVFTQEGYQSVKAIPFDFPIVGYGNGIVNTLRIWDAEPVECFQLDSFDKGDYQKAVEQENLARNIVEVLYPNDNHYAGKELRLKQQYFFISASVQEAVEKYMRKHDDIRKFHEKVTFQLNDTHPTVAIAELMRVLMDDYYLTWEEAWEITTKTCAYTNHTIMAEALEKWPIELFSRLLPRIYHLAKKYGIEIKERELSSEEKLMQSERESLFIVNNFARDYFQNILKNHVDGRSIGMAYFRNRGFRDDIIEKFQLGYCTESHDAMAQEAIKKGFKKEYLVKTGLCYETDDHRLRDRFWGRVIFPVHTLSGKVVAFGGRVLSSATKGVKVKYVNSPESEIYHKSSELYGIYFASNT